MVQDTIPFMHHALTQTKKHVLVEGGRANSSPWYRLMSCQQTRHSLILTLVRRFGSF